jgi:hypothetical protein
MRPWRPHQPWDSRFWLEDGARMRTIMTPDHVMVQRPGPFDRALQPAPPGHAGALHWRAHSMMHARQQFNGMLRQYEDNDEGLKAPRHTHQQLRLQQQAYGTSLGDEGRIERVPSSHNSRGIDAHIGSGRAHTCFASSLRSVSPRWPRAHALRVPKTSLPVRLEGRQLRMRHSHEVRV